MEKIFKLSFKLEDGTEKGVYNKFMHMLINDSIIDKINFLERPSIYSETIETTQEVVDELVVKAKANGIVVTVE